jgi:hypothetical protein
MTTTIFTSLLGPICEMYYKYNGALVIQQQNKNTYLNYGFNTQFSINFGFEVYQPFDLNNIKIQPGVYTYQSAYNAYPSNYNTQSYFSISNNNNWVLQDLPINGIGTVIYNSSTLPLMIYLKQNGNALTGIASNFLTSGIPYSTSYDIDDQIMRKFDDIYLADSASSMLIFVDFYNTTITGISTNWTVLPSSSYSYRIVSYRINNGYGQYYSLLANNSFLNNQIIVNTNIETNVYESTYGNVYNWINNLPWTPDFNTWFQNNKSSLNYYVLKFLSDYFQIS